MTKSTDHGTSGGSMPLVYVFMPSDGLGTQLISCKLNGRNYNTWSQAMQTALQAKNKLIFIEGKVTQSAEGEPCQEQWVTCNSMLLSWIFNHLDEELQNSVTGSKNAKTLWDDLTERFSLGNEAKIHQLKTDTQTREEERTILGAVLSVIIAGEMAIIGRHVISFTITQAPISGIRRIRRGALRETLEQAAGTLPRLLRSCNSNREEVESDSPIQEAQVMDIRAAHLSARSSTTVGNGGLVIRPSNPSLRAQRTTQRPRPMRTL
ncbi:hypothetical protein CRG98_043331 [Punica granatum]|uniref:Retrotransposon Copia-like N-terminal domain-containing protein n=1 Tax=Punica granatum TaxID=22663 RepID=A0A2I0HX78_PUNGR|nr:hypothetical protein CRG98_043331 [Punica granatum]